MVAKGRNPYGERAANSRLTPDIVRQMRVLRASGWLYREIAKHFDVSRMTASFAIRRITWKEVA